jgi:hypothetical protein
VIDGVKHFIKFLREGQGDSSLGVKLFYIGRDFIVGVFMVVVMNTMFGLDEFEWSRRRYCIPVELLGGLLFHE